MKAYISKDIWGLQISTDKENRVLDIVDEEQLFSIGDAINEYRAKKSPNSANVEICEWCKPNEGYAEKHHPYNYCPYCGRKLPPR